MAIKVNTVTARLMENIVSGKFDTIDGVDTLPPQEVLAREYKVSRTVLREAISKLESWNVITVRPKIGTKINLPHTWTMTETSLVLYRLRAEGIELSIAAINMVLKEMRNSLLVAAGFLAPDTAEEAI